jgi:hypothetical protein
MTGGLGWRIVKPRDMDQGQPGLANPSVRQAGDVKIPRIVIALLGSQLVISQCFFDISMNSDSGLQTNSVIELSRSVSLIDSQLIVFHRLFKILLNSEYISSINPLKGLSGSDSLICCECIISDRLLNIRRNFESGSKHNPYMTCVSAMP